MSAQMIENHLFSNQFVDAIRVHFHARAEFIGTLFEGLAAFAPDGTFLSANRSALFQFGQPLAELQRQPFDALFGVAFARLLQQIARTPGESILLTLPSGVRVGGARRIYAATLCRTNGKPRRHVSRAIVRRRASCAALHRSRAARHA